MMVVPCGAFLISFNKYVLSIYCVLALSEIFGFVSEQSKQKALLFWSLHVKRVRGEKQEINVLL